MKSHDSKSDNDYRSRAAANNLRQTKSHEDRGQKSPHSPARRSRSDMINSSPFVVSQAKRLRGLSSPALQKQASPEEDELLQGKFAAQMQEMEDEELMQGKSAVQRQGPEEDEEILQGKFTVQRQEPEEDEELLQGKFPVQRQGPEEDEELLQGKFAAQMQPEEDEELLQGKFSVQRRPAENRTGMPDELKAGMENTLNADFSQVRIHPDSSKANEVGALAYTQGTDVHFAPGQFKPESSAGKQLLGHELTHVVQQEQGRVKPTGEIAGLPVNDSPELEKEANETALMASNKNFNIKRRD